MVNKNDKLLSVYELEYGHLLNKQNIFLGFIGALIIAVLSIDSLPKDWKISKIGIIILLFAFALIILQIYNDKLEGKIKQIKKLKNDQE